MTSETVSAVDTDAGENSIADAITSRLNEAIPKGSAADIARRARIPYPSLREYLSGAQPRPAALVALARAVGVRIEWLMTGEGPMRAPASPAPDDPRTAEDVQALIAQGRTDHPFFSTIPGQLALRMAKPSAPPARLFGQVKIDRLVQAYEGALASTRGADKRLTMHLTVVLYDQLTEAAESQGNRASPADAPATAGATTAGVEP